MKYIGLALNCIALLRLLEVCKALEEFTFINHAAATAYIYQSMLLCVIGTVLLFVALSRKASQVTQ